MNYTYQKDIDTRDSSEIYVMKVTSELGKKDFVNLINELKYLGGYYSKFKKGFIFRENVEQELNKKFPNSILSKREIEDLKHISIVDFCEKNGISLSGNGNWRSLKEHNSCVIDVRNNSFVWNSRQKNGDIINFVQEYYDTGFREAAEILGAKRDIAYQIKNHTEDFTFPEEKKDIAKLYDNLNEQNNMRHVYAYLNKTRKIEYPIIQEFIDKGLIGEDKNRNIIFKTFRFNDKEKELVAISKKGTSVKPYQYINPHSENVGFRFPTTVSEKLKSLYLYEAPIDLMSHYEMNRDKLIQDNAILVAMTGLKPNAVLNNIKEYNPEKVIFCVDNDDAGRNFVEKMKNILPENLRDKIELLIPEKKDWNEDIKEKKYLKEQEEFYKTLENIQNKANKLLKNPALMKEFISFSSKFYDYSINNQILIYLQNPDAQFVGSKSFFNRQKITLKKEELMKSLKIVRPEIREYFYSEQSKSYKTISEATQQEKEQIEQGKIKVKKQIKYMYAPVYDITQTNLSKEHYPKFIQREDRKVIDNIDAKRTLIGMVNIIRRKNIDVEFEDLSNPDVRLGKKGYTNTKDRIVLNRSDTTENQISVLAHEYAHCILHNSDRKVNDLSKNIIEFEAETSAYMALEKCGILSQKDSPLYITGYGKEILKLLSENINNQTFSSIDILKDIQEGTKKLSEVLEKSIVAKQEIKQEGGAVKKEIIYPVDEKSNPEMTVNENGINFGLKKEMEQNVFWKDVFAKKERIIDNIERQEKAIDDAREYIKNYSLIDCPTDKERTYLKMACERIYSCQEKIDILNDKLKNFDTEKIEIVEEIDLKEEFSFKI